LPEERAQRCGIKTLGGRGKESDVESSGHEKETIFREKCLAEVKPGFTAHQRYLAT